MTETRYSTERKALIAGGLLVVLMTGGLWFIPETKIEVVCFSPAPLLTFQDDVNPLGNFTCTIKHLEGSAATVCWRVNLTCATGATTSAHACQAIAPGSMATRVIETSLFQPKSACSAVVGTVVDQMVVK